MWVLLRKDYDILDAWLPIKESIQDYSESKSVIETVNNNKKIT